jgi:hypothetical protein
MTGVMAIVETTYLVPVHKRTNFNPAYHGIFTIKRTLPDFSGLSSEMQRLFCQDSR